MTVMRLVETLIKRGVSFEAVDGGGLAIDPAEKLRPGELDRVKQNKGEILALLSRARIEREKCFADDCDGICTLTDGVGACSTCGIATNLNSERRQGPHGSYLVPKEWIN